ncbi:MAG: phosphoenolpyruvate--protein phosphotransferase, partial [Planctomycetes bacterium]|nr:phosphoenolpyruvate--protein phosphotransferase [Planctomycetota bacterium]
ADGVRSVYPSIDPHLPARSVPDAAAEEDRFRRVIADVGRELREQSGKDGSGDAFASLNDAQILILEDKDILETVSREIRARAVDAASLYQAAMTKLADQYRALPTAYLRARAADVQAVADRVIGELLGLAEPDPAGAADIVVFAPEIGVGHVLRSEGRVVGALTTVGGTTSHAALVMRSHGVPFIGGVVLPPGAKTGDRVLMDAGRAEVIVNPTADEVAAFNERRRRRYDEARERDRAASHGPAATADGVPVPVLANVGDSVVDLVAGGYDADGIGLLRTEFAFLGSPRQPDIDEQVEGLKAVFAAVPGRPVIVRTLDAGGDKDLPFLGLPTEANPFLGIRGIRLARRRPDVLRTQMEAILVAGAGMDRTDDGAWRIGIMAPMVAILEEIDEFYALLEDAHKALAAAGRDHAWPVGRGVMMETPAAVDQAEAIAGRVDFMSIGSNDLTQYLMCAERGSADLAYLADGMHPVVLAAIGRIARAGQAAGKSVSVCGELAADPEGALALVGLGVNRLSVDVHSVGPIKRLIRNADAARLRTLAEKALTVTSAAAARSLFAPEVEKGTDPA